MAETATDADVDRPPHPTVAKSAASCLHSFQQCVQKAASIHPRELSLVEDQLARFSVWTTNIRVFAPGRAALDHRLREAPDVQDAVVGLLDALAFRVQSCWKSLEPLSSKVAHESSQPLVEVDPKFRQSIQGIANEISLLHRFSNTIRRASKTAQNLKAADSFRIRDDEKNDAEDFITKLFVNHVRDKFPGVSDNICQRLAETMVLRRKRILYRRSRYGDTPIRPQETPSQPWVTVPKVKLKIRAAEQPQVGEGPQAAGDASKSAIQSVAQSATTLAPGNFQKASAPSVVSVSKTVALSNHEELPFPPAPLGSLKQKFHETRRQQEEIDKRNLKSLNNEDKLKSLSSAWKEKVEGIEEIIKAVGEVTCPFCFYALPAGDVIDDNKWRLHVKNDLDAYVCLFEDCSLPHELYVHSSAWLKHMREHAMRWRCISKSHGQLVCESRDDYLTHMKTIHKGKFSDTQLHALADRNGRVIGPLFRSCPLCGKEEVDGTMDNHIVGHLRFLALKSLPTYEDEGPEDEISQKGGSSASRAQSRRSTVESELKGGSLEPLEDITDVNGGSWHFFVWDSENQSKYAPYGGFHSYISKYHTRHAEEDSTNKVSPGSTASPAAFPPPPDDVKLLFNHFDDPSLEFVEASLFDGVPDTERLRFEWGFLPNQHEASKSLKDDPILQKFLTKYDHGTVGKSFLGPNVPPIEPSDAPNETEGPPTNAYNGFTFPPTHTRPPQSRRFSIDQPTTANTNDGTHKSPSLLPGQDSLTSYDHGDFPDFANDDDEPWFPLFPQDDTVSNQDNATSHNNGDSWNLKYSKLFNPEDIVFKDDVTERERFALSDSDTAIRQDNITPTPELAANDILVAGDDQGGQNQWPLPPLSPIDIGQQEIRYTVLTPPEPTHEDPRTDMMRGGLTGVDTRWKRVEGDAKQEDSGEYIVKKKPAEAEADTKLKETKTNAKQEDLEEGITERKLVEMDTTRKKARVDYTLEDLEETQKTHTKKILVKMNTKQKKAETLGSTIRYLPGHSSHYNDTRPGKSKSIPGPDHTRQSKTKPQTTSNENESDAINSEIIGISDRLSNLAWDMVDMENLRLDATISESLCAYGQYIPLKLTIHIPRGYPKTGSPEFHIKKTPGVTDKICKDLDEIIHNLNNRLDAVLTFLSGGIDVGMSIKQNSNKGQQEKDDEALRAKALPTTSWGRSLGNRGGMYTQEDRSRKYRTRLDPDCAICHAPATLECDCEAKGLDIASKQAESRIMSPIYNDIRAWVRTHAQDFVRERFERDMYEHQETTGKSSSGQGSTTEVVEGHMPPVKERVNATWTAAVQSFPETLEYFYSLVEMTLPSDDDPAVKDPPLNPLSNLREPSPWKQWQPQVGSDALELNKAETSKQGEAKKPEQEAKA
ncbi:hypothetical protein F4814DRAFT_432601 [Daldinia grandis]|nr:hypothetical protein F4814DRAFT_432601 [Daldinia grandis]